MLHVNWTDDLSVGIDVIDKQHMRIVEYINELTQAIEGNSPNRRKIILDILNDTIDYTESHFGFEEAMMEDAGYPFLRAHRKVHELFVHKVVTLKTQLENGEDIAVELRDALSRWLLNHIRNEDADYSKWVVALDKPAPGAAANAPAAPPRNLHPQRDEGWLTTQLKRFFGGRAHQQS